MLSTLSLSPSGDGLPGSAHADVPVQALQRRGASEGNPFGAGHLFWPIATSRWLEILTYSCAIPPTGTLCVPQSWGTGPKLAPSRCADVPDFGSKTRHYGKIRDQMVGPAPAYAQNPAASQKNRAHSRESRLIGRQIQHIAGKYGMLAVCLPYRGARLQEFQWFRTTCLVGSPLTMSQSRRRIVRILHGKSPFFRSLP
jgi:hypothetical protein